MTQNKKAEIQRKLSLVHAPKPPADLAERIKRQIPANLGNERERFSRSLALNLRVAASILLLVSGAFLMMKVLSDTGDVREKGGAMSAAGVEQRQTATFADRSTAAPEVASESVDSAAQNALEPAVVGSAASTQVAPTAVAAAPVAAATSAAPAREERRAVTLVAEAAPAPPAMAPPPPPPPAPMPAAPPVADAAAEGAAVGGVVGGVIGGVATEAQARKQTAAEMAAPAAEPVPPPAVASAPARSRTGLIQSANAADVSFGARDSVFGVSVDRQAFARVKSAIERGERPSGVNVEALVNYFAGSPRRARGDVRLEAEASPAPVRNEDFCCILRFTVDTASAEIPAGGSVPPVASNAKIEIEIDANAVTDHRRIGGVASGGSEAVLLRNTSVTSLYALKLRPNLSPRQRVASVRLTYRSVTDGKMKRIERVLRVSDLTRTWSTASRRHRLASLGAVWGESLQRTVGAADVAQRAEELATEEPKDERARELATLATKTSQLGGSGPTGSGR